VGGLVLKLAFGGFGRVVEVVGYPVLGVSCLVFTALTLMLLKKVVESASRPAG